MRHRQLAFVVTILSLMGARGASAQTYTTQARPATPGRTYTTAPRYYYQTPAPSYANRSVTPTTYVQPTSVATQPAAAAAPAATSGDYGFTAWLNGIRAQYGLSPVSFDFNLANWAAVNNGQQAARGMGHFVMGPSRRQNCAVGNSASIGSQWLNSPAHRAALLDPTVRFIGLAGSGAYWTLNLR
jgi:uncharacterized protein YkwD